MIMSIAAMNAAKKIKGLTPMQKFTCVALADFHHGRSNLCNPGIKTLADFMCSHEKTVRRSIKALKALDRIDYVRRRVGKGRRSSNYYILKFDGKIFGDQTDTKSQYQTDPVSPNSEYQTDSLSDQTDFKSHPHYNKNGKRTGINGARKKTPAMRHEESEALPFDSEAFSNAWSDWRSHLKEKRSPFTSLTVKAQIEMLGTQPEDAAIAMIRQSIEKGWTGLFPVKETSSQAAPAGPFLTTSPGRM